MENVISAELKNICKTYEMENKATGEVFVNTALSDISINFFTSEIHAILGENGAGKSTLVNIFSGSVPLSSGKIILDGKPVWFRSPGDALKKGIGIVTQEPLLIPNARVLENIMIGYPKRRLFSFRKSEDIPQTGSAAGSPKTADRLKTVLRNPFMRIRQARQRVEQLKERWGVELDLNERIKNLPADKKFYTALFTVLCRNPQFLILDEPASVFDEKKRRLFFERLKNFAKTELAGIILITHKLQDALFYADRISVLKKGRLPESFLISDLTKNADAEGFLKNKIFAAGNALKEKTQAKPSAAVRKKDGFEFEVLCNFDTGKKNERVKISAQKGRITGIAAFINGGAERIEDILSGMAFLSNSAFGRRRAFSGIVSTSLNEKTGFKISCKKITPAFLLKHKIGFIPSDRVFRASNPELTIEEFMNCYRFKRFFFDKKDSSAFIEKILKDENIHADIGRSAKTLSGGQLQRLILARCLAEEPQIIIAAEPMHGLDVLSTELLKRKFRAFAESGKTVIVLTKEFDTEAYKNFFDAVYFLGSEN